MNAEMTTAEAIADRAAVVFEFEMTDTFGGQPNYCWVRRHAVQCPSDISDRDLKALAKELFGLTGVKGEWDSYGDQLEFRPRAACIVVFVTYMGEAADYDGDALHRDEALN